MSFAQSWKINHHTLALLVQIYTLFHHLPLSQKALSVDNEMMRTLAFSQQWNTQLPHLCVLLGISVIVLDFCYVVFK